MTIHRFHARIGALAAILYLWLVAVAPHVHRHALVGVPTSALAGALLACDSAPGAPFACPACTVAQVTVASEADPSPMRAFLHEVDWPRASVLFTFLQPFPHRPPSRAPPTGLPI